MSPRPYAALLTAGLLVAGVAGLAGLAPPAAADPSYVDNGPNADGYRQIVLSDGGRPPRADTSDGPYRADISWTAPDGRPRTYRVIIPPGLPSPAPYVVTMGGLFLCRDSTQRQQNWEQYAEQRGYAVVYAQGVGCSYNAGGGCCGQAARDGVDDVAYLRSVLDLTESTWPRDAGRTMVAGFSNGGIMAYRFACEYPSLISSVGAVAASDTSGCRPKGTPVAVRHLHGDADTNVPYEGTASAAFCSCPVEAVPRVLKEWDKVNRTSGTATTGTLLAGVGHRWMTAADGVDATVTLGDFLLANPRR